MLTQAKVNTAKHGGKKKLSHVRVEKGSSGGYSVSAHYSNPEGPYMDPETRMFGDKDHKAMFAHVKGLFGMKDDEKAEGEKE